MLKKMHHYHLLICCILFAMLVALLTPPFVWMQVSNTLNASSILLYITTIPLAFALSIVVHELGHLLGGYMSGYHFVSFRLGPLLLTRTEEKFGIYYYPMPANLGECWMAPNKGQIHNITVLFYVLGGCFANFIATTLSIIPYATLQPGSLKTCVFIFMLISYFSVLYHAIPRKHHHKMNDGMRMYYLSIDRQSKLIFAKQLLIMEKYTQAYGFHQMPEEWFDLAEDYDDHNPFLSYQKFLQIQRLIFQRKSIKAEEAIEALLMSDKQMADNQRAILIMDLATIRMMYFGDNACIDILSQRIVQDIFKSMSHTLIVLRVHHLRALAYDKDQALSDAYLQQFKETVHRCPYLSEMFKESYFIGKVQDRPHYKYIEKLKRRRKRRGRTYLPTGFLETLQYWQELDNPKLVHRNTDFTVLHPELFSDLIKNGRL